MLPSLILFDIDGTLVDTAGAGRVALVEAFRHVFALEPLGERVRHVPFAGQTDLSITRALGAALAIDPHRLETELTDLQRCYLTFLERELARPEPRRRVLPGVRELLRDLQPRDSVHLGLLTGNIEGGARRKLGAFDLNHFFPGGGFGSDAADRRQVARAAHLRMCEIAGVDFDPARVTVVGDTGLDIDCARANGFRSIAVRTGWAGPGELEAALPDALLDDLTDRAGFLRALAP